MQNEVRPVLTTTLYDLISDLHAQVGSEDDQTVITLVAHLLRAGRITFSPRLNA